MKYKKRWVLIGMLLLLFLGGCQGKNLSNERKVFSHFAMDTHIQLIFYQEGMEALAAECFSLIDRLDAQFSISGTGSIYQINHQGRGVLPYEEMQLLGRAIALAEWTMGAFDPALLSLKELWNIRERKATDPLPTQEEIATARFYSGYSKVAIKGESVRLEEGVGLDLGGILKGYAGDICANYLKDQGVGMAILNMGGSIRVLSGKEYTIGIRNPRGEDEDDIYGTVTQKDVSIVTSGDYERYLEVDGVRYHHIFDPQTGSPARSGVMSVTVVAQDGTLADALSTAFFVMGVEKSMAFLQRQKPSLEVDVIFVTEEKEIFLTEGIRDSFRLTEEGYRIP